MRLSVCVLLLSLALGCNQANALACPTLVTEKLEFLNLSPNLYKLSLKKFHAPDEDVDAILKVKECTNQISLANRKLIEKALTEILLKKCTP